MNPELSGQSVDRLILVDASIAEAANLLAAPLPGTESNTWNAGVRPKGTTGPATHYALNGKIAVEFDEALQSPENLVAMLSAWGQELSLESATYLLSKMLRPVDQSTTGLGARAELGFEMAGGEE